MHTVELKRLLRRVLGRHFGDVCPADLLPIVIKHKPKAYIVNTDESHKPGKHWVAFYFPKRGFPEFFDPEGRKPEFYHRRFKNVLIVNGSKYKYNQTKLQGPKTCGEFCLYYIIHRYRGLSMKKILEKFHTKNFVDNDRKVISFLNHV